MRKSKIADCTINEATDPAMVTAHDIASYAGDISIQLSRMSAAKSLTLLAALLQLASIEAKRIEETH